MFVCAWCLVFWWFLVGCVGLLSVCIAFDHLVFCCILVIAFLGSRLNVVLVWVCWLRWYWLVCVYDLFAMFTSGGCWVVVGGV